MQSLLPALVSLTLILLTGCGGSTSFWNFFGANIDDTVSYVPEAPYADLPPPMLSIHAEEITAIVQEYAVELKNLKRLHLRHANTYYNEEGIQTIQMQFISQDIIELCQARKLIIDVSEGYLEKLNSNCVLIPEFADQGFFPSNLEIYIDFESYFIKYIDPFYVKWIIMEDGFIDYISGDAIDNEKKGWHSRREAYETSRNIVFYERLAEDQYKAMHEPDRAIFGNKRFWQTNLPPPNVLE
jgi:hypothetical protein